MNECCSSSGFDATPLKKYRCPVNGHAYSEVSVRTISHHIKEAWAWLPSGHRYFFCEDPACEVAYFGDDGSTILQSQMRTQIGLKEASDSGLLCYCFGITKRDFRNNPVTRDYVVTQTQAGKCSCDISNPSGRCCLKDFPKPARK
jgi:hypothetical protein